MRVLMASKALVVSAYHAKLEALGTQPGIELSPWLPTHGSRTAGGNAPSL